MATLRLCVSNIYTCDRLQIFIFEIATCQSAFLLWENWFDLFGQLSSRLIWADSSKTEAWAPPCDGKLKFKMECFAFIPLAGLCDAHAMHKGIALHKINLREQSMGALFSQFIRFLFLTYLNFKSCLAYFYFEFIIDDYK